MQRTQPEYGHFEVMYLKTERSVEEGGGVFCNMISVSFSSREGEGWISDAWSWSFCGESFDACCLPEQGIPAAFLPR
jgi:hypothetical protein